MFGAMLPDEGTGSVDKAGMFAKPTSRFEFDVYSHSAAYEAEHFVQRGNFFGGERPMEPRAGAQALQLFEGMPLDGAAPVGCPLEPGIMEYDQFAVAREPDVEFDGVSPVVQRASKCREGILRRA